MPIGNAPSQTPPRDRALIDSSDSWAMPLGHLAGTRLGLSYSVFFAAAIVVAVVLTASRESGNSDLPRAAALGTAFWVCGWFAQSITHLVLARFLGLRVTGLNIGLIGVEAAPRRWPTSSALLISVCTVGSLLVLGALFRLVEGGFRIPVLLPAGSETWAAPSIGFADHDSIWRSAAWLCWAQAVLQMYPLPRTMGRQMIAALAGISGRRHDLAVQATLLRRCLSAVALMTLALALVLVSRGEQLPLLNWPILVLLGLLLWGSSRGRDVTDLLEGFRSPQADSFPDAESSGGQPGRQQLGYGVIGLIRSAMRSRRDRKRARLALQQEHDEAVDAQRLDEILNRLHHDGIDSLDGKDRQILDRVSANLRRQREADSKRTTESD